ncbi:MAG TPA: formate dehydrogenase accessory sulfurtransferase FdhD [Actinocrinis sp.]|nr:formate dehydrogenase accessory sulfurtransferase FdhD [Actinocrinis sp.]
MSRNVQRVPVVRWQAGAAAKSRDTLVVEEPLELRIGGEPLAVTMRTPGDDFDLAAGYLVGEGVVRSPDHLARMRFCGDAGTPNTYNVLDIDLAPGVQPPGRSLQRNSYTTSACGVCGKSSIEAVHANTHWSVADDPVRVTPEILCALPDALRAGQRLFEQTGGLHAAGLFTPAGELLCIREDVGRHNAVDKVVGWALREGRLPLRGTLLAVSGRASFELVQKAAAAGLPVLAAVSAPSSLAVELAGSAGLTLAGFVRGGRATVYTGAERVPG